MTVTADPRDRRDGAAPSEALPEGAPRVCVGTVVGAHGIAGLVRVRSYTANPADLAAYGPLWDETGRRRVDLAIEGEPKGVTLLCRVSGVEDRTAAEALKGLRLYVPRSALPEAEEEEYYHADLLGLRVESPDGSLLGTVRALYDFGAGDVLEVVPTRGGQTLVVPFTREAVPVIDLAGRRVVVVPPEPVTDEEGRE